MSTVYYTSAQIVERGEAIYQRNIRPGVETCNRGKMLALDIETGAYEIAEDSLTALDRVQAGRLEAPVYILRIGYPTAVKM